MRKKLPTCSNSALIIPKILHRISKHFLDYKNIFFSQEMRTILVTKYPFYWCYKGAFNNYVYKKSTGRGSSDTEYMVGKMPIFFHFRPLEGVGGGGHSGCLDPKKIFPLLIPPQGSQGCQKITFFFYKWNCFPFALRLPPKLQKPSKLKKKCQKNPCFNRLFWIFFNLGQS